MPEIKINTCAGKDCRHISVTARALASLPVAYVFVTTTLSIMLLLLLMLADKYAL
jgi:hypothetical protein